MHRARSCFSVAAVSNIIIMSYLASISRAFVPGAIGSLRQSTKIHKVNFASIKSPCCWYSSASASASITTSMSASTSIRTMTERKPQRNHFTSISATIAESIDPSQETIFALSSGYNGQQATAVAVLRISGSDAHTILKTLSNPNSKPPPPRRAVLRKLYHDDRVLDHALVLSFEGPNSFTGEDLVEIHCHGSRAVVQGLLDVLPLLGCRMADPGEFTQRAFGNGKFDLVQVEALADILGADTQMQLQQALNQLDGKLSKIYEDWRAQLVSGLAHAEAVIDFGDDERLGEDDILDDESAQWDVWGEVATKMRALCDSMERHLQDGRKGELVRDGVNIAILGPPNAGKSSLFNVLAQKDAAIVSPIAGTTRDVLQVNLDLGGVKCTLQDTAGVRSETSDLLELEGMKRARRVAEEADFVVAVVDTSDEKNGLDTIDFVLSDSELSPSKLILLSNKIDLPENGAARTTDNSGELVQRRQRFASCFDISCVTQEGIDHFLRSLTDSVVDRIKSGDDGSEGALITRARHRKHVEGAAAALERFAELSGQGTMAVDMAAEELRLAASELGRITGAVDVEDVLDVLFTDFCIGK